MSMHRPKRASFRSNPEPESPFDKKTNTQPSSWKDAVADKGDSDFRPYVVKATYAVGDGLTHPKFGNGVVVEAESTKIAVLFQSGERRLAHAVV